LNGVLVVPRELVTTLLSIHRRAQGFRFSGGLDRRGAKLLEQRIGTLDFPFKNRAARIEENLDFRVSLVVVGGVSFARFNQMTVSQHRQPLRNARWVWMYGRFRVRFFSRKPYPVRFFDAFRTVLGTLECCVISCLPTKTEIGHRSG
jgi:hypothetical protein